MLWKLMLASALLALGPPGQPAVAEPRQLVFVVENAQKDPAEPPTSDQMRTAHEVLAHLAMRARSLEVDGHSTIGPDYAAAADAAEINKADAVVQVLTSVSARGLAATARIYEKGKNAWFRLPSGGVIPYLSVAEMEAQLADRVLPNAIVQLFEHAHNPRQPLLLTDCLFPEDNKIHQVARHFTDDYPGSLERSDRIRQKFTVVRLIPPYASSFYNWWCVRLNSPRYGYLRRDTVTVYGYVEPVGDKPEIRLLVARPDRRKPAERFSVDLNDKPSGLKRILDSVERLANEM
jgi:hypothetical protein